MIRFTLGLNVDFSTTKLLGDKRISATKPNGRNQGGVLIVHSDYTRWIGNSFINENEL